MSFTSVGTHRILPVAPTPQWRRDTWRALSDAGRRRTWSLMNQEQRAAFKAALKEAEEEAT